jgi:hypothetical protein
MDVPGVEADAEFLPRGMELPADGDRVLDPAVEGIVGVDEEDRPVGVDVGVGEKASYSEGKDMTHEWAMVPMTGIPKRFAARVLEVPFAPPM